MSQIRSSNECLQTVANAIMNEHEAETHKLLTIQIIYKEIFGRLLEYTSYEVCSCMGDWCNYPMLHGFRLDGMTIKEVEEIINKSRGKKLCK